MVVPRSPDELFPWLLDRLGIDPDDVTNSPMVRPGRPIVGVSEHTAQKLWELFRLIDVVVSYTAMINRGRQMRGQRLLPFAGLDLSAGCGPYLNPATHAQPRCLVGSPLQLLEALVRHRMTYRLALFEQNAEVVALLRGHLATAVEHLGTNASWVSLVEGSFCELAIPWIEQNVRSWMPGLMIVDVNGVFDLPALREIARCPQLNHVDVALHLPMAMSKWPRRRVAPASFDELQAAFGKQYWQYAQDRGNYQWTWVYGTNNPKMRVLAERAFVASDSASGHARRERLTMTRAAWVQRDQLALFTDVSPPRMTDG